MLFLLEELIECYDYIYEGDFYTCRLVLLFKNGYKVSLKVVNNSEYQEVYQILSRNTEGARQKSIDYVRCYLYIQQNGEMSDSYYLVKCYSDGTQKKIEVNSLDEGYKLYKSYKKSNEAIFYGCSYFQK